MTFVLRLASSMFEDVRVSPRRVLDPPLVLTILSVIGIERFAKY